MTWGMVAVAGATVVTGVMSSRSADKASDKAARSGDAAIAFEQERYDDWQEIYGPVQENLASYYSTLTPEYFEARGLETYQREHQAALETIEADLAQRGIESSGIATSLRKDAAFEKAEQRATIRAQAPAVAASEQRQFLQIGLGQDPGPSLAATLSQQASSQALQAQQAEAAAGKATGQAIQSVGTALDAYINRPQTPVTTTTP